MYINVAKFEEFLSIAINKNLCSNAYQKVFKTNFKRKALEHFISFEVLYLQQKMKESEKNLAGEI